ncbi:MAG: tail fiber domain-containing protein [Vicingaceae bacterium]|nr:tail fiber domain-containing protein [Flavobacteriales bacterium]MDF1676800.1 tail fiber domain-containing protein [Vicingaceae bacterium]
MKYNVFTNTPKNKYRVSKNKIKLFIIANILAASVTAQVTTWGNAGISTDYVGWDNTNAFPLQIRHNGNEQIHTYTNNLMRMKIMPGGGTIIPLGGQVAFGSNLGAGFTPVDRIHLHQQIVGGFTPSFFNGIRMTNNVTGSTNLDGTQIGILDTGTFYIRQYEVAPVIFELPDSRNAGAMTNWLHISNGLTGYAGDITDGFVGLNEDSAKFHLDIKTPAISNSGSSYGGELFLSCRTSDVPNSRMGMLNIAGGNGIFVPSLFGNMDASQPGTALSTIAVINPSQDLSINIQPVQQFIVGSDWDYNTNALDAISEIENRNAFAWKNVGNVKMLMDAKGRVEIGNNTNLAGTITNRLVVASSTADPGNGSVATPGGSSGVRLKNLTASTPDITNPGEGVLAVDSLGNIIYVEAGFGGDFGNYCSDPQNPLTGNYEIPLDNNNFLFSDDFGTGQILMGDVSCSNTTDARVYIRNNTNSSGLQKGIFVQAIDPNGIGGDFEGNLYGIRATAPVSVGYAGWFDGDVYINGVGTGSSGVFYTSDQQFKTNIDTIANATHIIQQLNPKTFFFDTVSTPQIKFGSERQYGFIAQEVELILPELVSEHTFPAQYDSLGNQTSAAINYKGLNYNAFIAILMKGMQDQQATLDDKDSIISNLNDRLTTLENCLSGILPLLCQLSNASVQENDETTQKQLINELKVILEDNQNIVLEQNAPNPFAEQTVINYFIPEAVQQAQIVFYNLGGKMIQTVNITEKGNGKLTVYGNDLSSGTYTYSLIADGKLIATKKMVKK